MAYTKINSGQASNANLNAYIVIATLAAPVSGTAQYLLVIRLSNLGVGHRISVRSTRAAVVYIDDQPENGAAADLIEWTDIAAVGDPDNEIAIIDALGASPTAAYSWELYQDTGAGGGGGGTRNQDMRILNQDLTIR